MPFFTVIIPVYNNRRFLKEAVESVQDSDAEIIVVDDGSTDGCAETITDTRAEIVRLPENRGVAAAQNEGLRVARGEWVTFLDSDDRMAPQSLQWRRDFIEMHPEARVFGGLPAGIIDGSGTLVRTFTHMRERSYSLPEKLNAAYYSEGKHYPVGSCFYTFRQDLFAEVGVFDECANLAQDFDFLLRVLDVVDIPLVRETTFFRRWHDANLSILQSGGEIRLRDDVIRACSAVMKRRGMRVPERWIPFEMML